MKLLLRPYIYNVAGFFFTFVMQPLYLQENFSTVLKPEALRKEKVYLMLHLECPINFTFNSTKGL